MKFGNLEIPGQVILAPMAGVTDYAFRTVCAAHGADVTVTEMVSSRALCYGDKKSISLLRRTEKGVCAVQLFGNEPEIMAQAAVLALEKSGCDYIDINMGCPVPKIAGSGDGSALMRDPVRAGEIVAAVKEAVPVPVTVKCRKGWDKGSVNAVEFAEVLEKNGADAIAVHGRTKTMMYSGLADWDIIHDVVQAVHIPVIANGDIFGPDEAVRCLRRTGAAGVMIGRTVFGNPFVLEQISAALRGEPVPAIPPLRERVDTALEQFRLAAEDKGERIACLEARKHFAWYLRGVAHSSYYKEKISAVTTMAEIERIAKGIQNDLV